MLVGPAAHPDPCISATASKSHAFFKLPDDSFSNACHQYLEDHDHRPSGPGTFIYGISQLLGHRLARRLSNFTAYIGLGQFYAAQRDYPTLSPCDEMAARFRPGLHTIDASFKPTQLRYEILPPQEDKDYYSIVYFMGSPTEKLPMRLIGRLYDWVRPILFGTKQDWEAIQIDIDRTTLDPIGISYETANYTNSLDTVNIFSSKDLHLYSKATKLADGKWEHTVRQKNGRVQTTEILDPFRNGGHPQLAIVSWNNSLDLCDRVAGNSNLKLLPIEELEAHFMDMETYRKEGIDMRAAWLKERRLGKVVKSLPPRAGFRAPA